MRINRQDTNGVKPLLAVGELGYDNYPSGGDIGRVYVGTGSSNIAQAKKSEVVTVDGKVDTHVARIDNPHGVTKTQVGLSNVDNTSDVNKPVSIAVQSALDTKQDVLVSGTNVKTIEGQSIVGSGNIDLSKSAVGLDNVDNTADSLKVVASAGKWTTSRLINGTAVDGTVDVTTSQWGTSRNITIGNTAKSVNGSADTSWSLAEIGAIGTASPAFTGVPTAPTAAVNNNSNQIATTAYVASQVANTAVALTGNQTVDGIKTFSSNIVGNITGNSGTATSAASAAKWTNARTITLGGVLSGSVSIDGSANVTLSAQVYDNSHNHTGLSGTVLFSDSTGNSFTTSNIEVRGNGNTVRPGIGFHQPALYAGTLEMLDGGTFQFKTQAGQLATVAKSPNDSGVKTALNASGTAPIYACRAWVNFNGTGTVAIRASGNVSSITDNGVGDYTVNFTTAMTSADYCSISSVGYTATAAGNARTSYEVGIRTTSAIRYRTSYNDSISDQYMDPDYVNVSIFR